MIIIDSRDFVHLHVHTEYSLLESTCRLEALIQKAKSMNMKSMAITDKGSINGIIRFSQLAEKYGIHPILGCEMKVAEEETLIVLAVTNTGYETIVKWINFGFFEPVSRGDIIGLSGGRNGAIYQLLKEGEFFQAEEIAMKYVRWFGKENFYLEIQNHNFKDDNILIKRTIEFSNKLDIPVVATHDIHYLEPEDVRHLIVLKGQEGEEKGVKGQFYFSSQEEMKEKFCDFPEALKNTSLIAKRCQLKEKLEISRLPRFPIPDNENEETYLRKICLHGLHERFDFEILNCLEKHNIMKRLNYELDTIFRRQLASYFLIVWDMVNFARERKISIGPGRGSSAGSLVAFLLGITQVNPILHKLSFERFLSLDRLDLPDIDLDVCQRRRSEILEYIKEKYGHDKVIHVGVCNTFGTRGSIRKVGAFLRLKKKQVDIIASLLPSFRGIGGIRHCMETLPELKKLPVNQEPYKSLFTLAEKIEGLPHNYSSHPSGIIIGDKKLSCTIPLKQRSDGDFMTTFNKNDIKALGLLKFDLLGLRNLTIIEDIIESIHKLTGKEIEITNIDLNDQETFRTINDGNTLGCFQLESMGIRYIMRQIKPKNIEELAVLLALYRPGAFKAGIVKTYIKRRSGKEKIHYLCSELESILSSTYGLIIYQEQVMEIAHVIAGYSMGKADSFRRALAKKQVNAIALHRKRFVLGAINNGYTEHMASKLFEFLAQFAGYSFNKAHSISYAYISYWTIYLKIHYPKEYMASLLSLEGGYYDKKVYIRELKKMGIPLLGPNVNQSGIGFQSEKDGIRIGLDMIKGSGPRSVGALLYCRQKEGVFTSFEELIIRMKKYKVYKPVINAWINVGACDELGNNNRKKMFQSLNSTQIGILEYLSENGSNDYSEREKRKLEKELLGFSLRQVSQNRIKQFLEKYNVIPIETLSNADNNQRVRISGTIIHLRRQPTKNGEYLLNLLLQDHTDMVEVIIYTNAYKKYLYELNPEGIIVQGLLQKEDMKLYVIAEKIKSLGG